MTKFTLATKENAINEIIENRLKQGYYNHKTNKDIMKDVHTLNCMDIADLYDLWNSIYQ